MLAAAAWRTFAAALVVLLLARTGNVAGAPQDDEMGSQGPATTGICDAPITIEPGVNSVHCTSPAIRMTPGQVCDTHNAVSFRTD
ncbi:hypothetical protein MMC14_010531 [Varicellaria rhodocarpa]|nr:hypothetical protein [Varicellaria rhodocarpa]